MQKTFDKKKFLSQNSIWLVLIAMVIIMGVAQPSFFTVNNLLTLLSGEAVKGILAFGVMFAILSKGIDLTIGASAGLVACIENLCLSPHGVSSIERSARLHDMLEAQRTRQMVAALKGNHRGLGLLYGSIASAKPMRCALYTHLAAFFNRSGVRTV